MTAAFFDPDLTPEETQKAVPEAAPAARRSQAARSRKPAGLLLAAGLQTAAALIWIPQATLLAFSIGVISDGGSTMDVVWAALAVLAFGFVRAALDAAGARVAFRTARDELTSRRNRAVAALAARSPLDIGKPASGLAASVVGEQAEAIVPYLARFRPVRMKASAVPLVILACVFPVSWIAGLILLVTAPLIPIFMALIGWRAKAASEKQLAETGGLNAFLLDRLRGLATIRALGAVDITATRLRADADSLRKRTMAVLKIAFLSSAVLELFAALGVAATAVYIGFSLLGSIDVGTWHGRLSLAQGLFILLLAPAFFEPLRELSAVWHDRANGEAALAALDALSSQGTAILDADEQDASDDRMVLAAPSVQIDRLIFRYAPDLPAVIDKLGLNVAAGEHVALWGASGSGKTTILSLIAGLAPQEAGVIRIGGVPLTKNSAAPLRQRMAWIGQRPHIFSGSLKRNIGLGRPDIDDGAIDDALRAVRLDTVIAANEIAAVGESGLGLSGGEALRLALARVAANRAAGIILADEPTAHLDAATAAEVTEALLALAKGRTLIVATHDPLLASRLDRTIGLEPHHKEIAA
ncbi:MULTISPECIES: thiol reductant ABC exporter subunit CydD [unclassified Rhizobium]|uniref:thiol reductant ABC exporter subunit CydD n=1 Tax=unclassified Rhizobium TaxID=2613769 RepID=UPI000CDF4368|nr:MULTISPECIES: thiol reductant ABC exporter subunit CydD [Rhizobium]AVA22500.1 cysteine ABC transporter ATP-binding/permease protein CydD [Rhizobium sp. NXC24]UWU23313.1 thiol reductant ABC exporter subunit CydD [Rhizobium tropici]